jgi:hypothetical protein
MLYSGLIHIDKWVGVRQIQEAVLKPAILLGIILGILGANVLAQTPGQILINYPQVEESETTASLGIYFNVVGLQGQVDTAAQVESATILLEDGVRYTATVSQPDSPIYIMLVLDASGTMTRAAADMRAAAIEAVGNAPENAQFAVMRFNSEISLLQEFTDDRDAVVAAIEQVQAVNQSGTCLFDASYQAIEELSKLPAGRRAIILFTDGQRDEVLGGEPCSTHVFDEVVALANQANARVPIHTIGLIVRADADTTLLRNLASNTGGLTAIGEQGNLSDLFQQILNALSAQWLAQADVCPLAGSHSAQVLITLEGGVFPQPALTYFTTTQDCILSTPTPEPTIPTEVVMTVNSIQLSPGTETVAMDMSVTGEERVREYRFEFKNEDTNLLLGEFSIPAPLTNPIELPTRSLDDGDTLVVISAFDENDQIISRTQETFTYIGPTPTAPAATNTPTPIGATIETVQYDEASNHVTLNLELASPEQIASLQVNVVDAQTRLLVNTFDTEVNETIDLDFNGFIPGEYTLSVIAENEAGQNISDNSVQFLFDPPLQEPGSATVSSFELSPELDTATLAMELVNEESISDLEITFVNTRSNVLALSQAAQPAAEVEIDLSSLPPGEYNVSVISLDENGAQLSRTATEFTYLPVTPTPVEISALVDRFELSQDRNTLTVNFLMSHPDQIEQIQLDFINKETNILAKSYTVVPAETLDLELEGLPGGSYVVNVISQDASNNVISRTTSEFVYTPTIAEEAAVTTAITSVEIDNEAPAFVLTVRSEHPDLIERYQVQLRNEENNLLSGRFEYTPPENSKIEVDLEGVEEGTYTLLLTAFAEDDSILAEATYEGAVYTPVKPGLLDSPIFIGVIGLVVVGLGGVLFMLLRRPSKEKATVRVGTPMLQQLTMQQKIVKPEDVPSRSPALDKTFVAPAVGADLPLATLSVDASADDKVRGRKVIITETPFVIGRNGKNLAIVDNRVSREHVQIIFENGQFYVIDLDSANGTFLDDERVLPQTPTALRNGSKLRLGVTTEIIMKIEASSPGNTGGDMDKTMYGG